MMKITLLIYGSLDSISGGYIYDKKIVYYLRSKGDEVDVVSIDPKRYLLNVADNFSTPLRKRLENLDTDVLIQDELCHPSLFLLNRRIGPVVKYPIFSLVHHLRCSEHRAKLSNLFYAFIEKRYLGSVDGYIFNCLTTLQKVHQLSGMGENSAIAYPAGDRFSPSISEAEITSKVMAGGKIKIIFLANIIERKGLHLLIEALSKIPPQGWTLTVIGRQDAAPAYYQKIQKQVDKYHLKENIAFLGKVDEQTISACLMESHLLCMPSSYEGYGIAYLEAMSFGLALIGSTSGGAVEIIGNGENGFLVNPHSVHELQAALTCLIDDREELLRMSLASLKKFKQQPTWDDAGEKIRGFLYKHVNLNG